jgi:hypothetical protein
MCSKSMWGRKINVLCPQPQDPRVYRAAHAESQDASGIDILCIYLALAQPAQRTPLPQTLEPPIPRLHFLIMLVASLLSNLSFAQTFGLVVTGGLFAVLAFYFVSVPNAIKVGSQWAYSSVLYGS